MANKQLFQSRRGRQLPKADTINQAGGIAYAFSPAHALAQYAATGCLTQTFYATQEDQLETVLRLAQQVDSLTIAKVAIYARERGLMKDMPALLCAVLAVKDGELLGRVFHRVIDSPKMLRNFVQIVRSGVTGRKSLGSRPKRLVRSWLAARSDEDLFRASVGNDPSLADLLRMVHPKPGTRSRAALYGYILGQTHDAAALPAIVREYESFKARVSNPG